jgi:mRNA-degrading endonuclease RelE of RelBE toxin-antitoxin system
VYNIDWTPKALKQLSKIDRIHRNDIVDAVDALHDFPKAKHVIALTNHKYGYRLRVGNYRVLFDADTAVKIIDIQQVVKRDDNTY